MKEVVESFVEDGRRSNVGRKWLIISCCRSMESFDSPRGIDSRGTRVLIIEFMDSVSYESRKKVGEDSLVREDQRCFGILVLLSPIPDTSLDKYLQNL